MIQSAISEMEVHQNPFKYYIFLIPCIISRIFGVLGFSITSNLKVENSIMSRIYSVAMFIGFFIYFILEFRSSNEFFNDNYRKSIIYFEFVVYWCASLSCIFLTIITQNKLLDWVKKSLETFKELKLEDKKLKRMLVFVCGRYALGFTLVIIYTQLSFFVRQQPNMTYSAQLLYLALCSVLMIILLAFSSGVFLIFIFFKEINRELLEIFEESLENSEITSVSLIINEYKNYLLKEGQKNNKKMKGIQNLSKKHHSYCILAMKLNDCFSLQILLFTALCFIELTYSMYYMIMSTKCTSDICINVKAAMAFAFSWMIFYAYQLGGCAISCQFLKDEVRLT